MTAFRPMPSFTGKEELKVFRGETLIGTVTDLDSDWPWMIGRISLTDAAKSYAHFWEFWTTEDNIEKEPPFEVPEDLEENWFVEDEQGERTQVCFPAVHDDGFVWWRNY